jgi:SAM-dependent methyltransferase
MSDNGGDHHSDSDSSSGSEAPNWDLLKETLGADALKALEEHMANDDEEAPTVMLPDAEAPPSDSIELPKNNLEYGKKEYWDDRFAKEKDYDWLVGYEDVQDLIAPYMTESAKVLLVGCGNSNFSAELYDAGFHNLTNIDYSEVVIDTMKKKYKESRPDMKWLVR